MTEHYSDERRNFLKTIALLSGAAASLPLTRKAIAGGKPVLLLPEKPDAGLPGNRAYQEILPDRWKIDIEQSQAAINRNFSSRAKKFQRS